MTEERLVGICTYQRIYDLTGNVKTYTATEDGQPSITTSYLYNDQDQLLTETSPAGTISYGYDDNGSLTSKTTSGGTEGYDYDLQGRLRAYTPVTGPSVLYAYDPDGQRIGKTAVTGITEYVVDPYNPTGYSQVLAETTGMTTTCYIHGSDMIGQSVGGASPQYFLYDGHGSVRQLTMSTGLLVGGQDFWYDAWGNELTSNTPLTSYLYCGEQRDGETGLYYLRARMYDPQTGRFTSRDPFAGNGTDPQSLHKYLYCHGNPVNGVDPSGMFNLSEINIACAFRSTMMAMNITGGIYHARGIAISTLSLINVWGSGDFWGGLPHVVIGSLHGVGLVASASGIAAGFQGPPAGAAPALAVAGGGALSTEQFWAIVVSNPTLARWVLDQVAPAAYSGYMAFSMRRNGGDNYQGVQENHHKVPHSNTNYKHEDHPLMKEAGWDNDELINNPANQMKLYNHHGRHWNQYHQEIKRLMDEAYRDVAGQGQQRARERLKQLLEEIDMKIRNGELKPYKNKDVW